MALSKHFIRFIRRIFFRQTKIEVKRPKEMKVRKYYTKERTLGGFGGPSPLNLRLRFSISIKKLLNYFLCLLNFITHQR